MFYPRHDLLKATSTIEIPNNVRVLECKLQTGKIEEPMKQKKLINTEKPTYCTLQQGISLRYGD